MKRIDNLKEKELLIAHYFCNNTKKELTPFEVYDMWCNWFKRDFRVNNESVFKVIDDELVYRKKSTSQEAEKLRREYNHLFQNIYKWIEKTIEIEGHDKVYFKQQLEAERNREYGRVIRLAKPLNFYLAMNKSYNQLAEFKLIDYEDRKHTLTSGNCDKMIEYLQQMEKEKIKERKYKAAQK